MATIAEPRVKPEQTSSVPAVNLLRKDTWWIEPVLTVLILVTFIIYGTVRGFEFNNFDTHRSGLSMHYLSPFYSPPLQDWFHFKWALSPAFVVLMFPASFRATCYFCRRSYYRAFFWDPPACAVPEILRKSSARKYTGERSFPLELKTCIATPFMEFCFTYLCTGFILLNPAFSPMGVAHTLALAWAR